MLNLFNTEPDTDETRPSLEAKIERTAKMETACINFVETFTQALQAVLGYAAKREAEADEAKKARGQHQ